MLTWVIHGLSKWHPADHFVTSSGLERAQHMDRICLVPHASQGNLWLTRIFLSLWFCTPPNKIKCPNFSLVLLVLKNGSVLRWSPCCLFVRESRILTFECITSLYETSYVYHDTWAHPKGLLHKFLTLVCVCMCIPPIVRQRLSNVYHYFHC